MYQHRDLEKIEKRLNKDFERFCDRFVDNKLSIHFGEDETKSIFFLQVSVKLKIQRNQI